MILKKILLQRKKILIFGKNSFIGSNLCGEIGRHKGLKSRGIELKVSP